MIDALLGALTTRRRANGRDGPYHGAHPVAADVVAAPQAPKTEAPSSPRHRTIAAFARRDTRNFRHARAANCFEFELRGRENFQGKNDWRAKYTNQLEHVPTG